MNSQFAVRIARLLLALLFSAACVAFATERAFAQPQHEVVPGQYLFKWNDEKVEELKTLIPEIAHYPNELIVQALTKGLGLNELSHLPELETRMAETRPGETFDLDFAIELYREGLLEYIEPNYVVHPTAVHIPNDPEFGNLWGLNNTGQSGGKVGFDIDAPEAWGAGYEGDGVVVMVIDTGVDYNHPDLAANMWVNPGEVPDNGVDDDNDGVIDDIHGYDPTKPAAQQGDPMDGHDHGSHCSGTIAGVGDNNVGVTGVAPKAKIIACRFLIPSGSTSDAIKCINYGVMLKNKYNLKMVMSNSWGGGGYSSALATAIQAANDAGIPFIAAAGNDNNNNDASASYPANYDIPNVISVAAIDRYGAIAGFSNYGATTVDIAAPGVSILSSVRGTGYSYFNGTSMATPHVSGVAALVLAKTPALTAKQVKDIILESGTPLQNPAPSKHTLTDSMLNAMAAVGVEKNLAPTLEDIPEQFMSYKADTMRVTPVAHDHENDALTWSVQADVSHTLANSIDTTYGVSAYSFFNIYGLQEKWMTAANSKYVYIVPDGKVFLYPGESFLGQLPSNYYEDPNLLINASSTGPRATAYMDGNDIVIDPVPNFLGTFDVKVTVSDAEGSDSRTFNVTVRNLAPTISAIPDATVGHGATYSHAVNIADEDGDTLTTSITARTLAQLAKVLDDQYNFFSDGNYHFNQGGQNAKFFSGSGSSSFGIKPNGELWRWYGSWNSSVFIERFTEEYYENPMLFFDVANPLPFPGAATLNGGNVNVSAPADFNGTAHITIEVSDGTNTARRHFLVTFANGAPVINPIAEIRMERDDPDPQVAIVANDPDGDTLTYTARYYDVARVARELDEAHNFTAANDIERGQYGRQAVFIRGDGGAQLYYILTDGTFGKWNGAWSISPILAKLDESYHQTPTKLVDAPAPGAAPATVTLAGTTITIKPLHTFRGSFQVEVIVSDGMQSSRRFFTVIVENKPPTLASIGDQSMQRGDGSKNVALSMSDPDGDPLTATATVQTVHQVAYDLDQQLNFAIIGSPLRNLHGKGEVYVFGRDGKWYSVLPNGDLYRFLDSWATAVKIATLDASFNENPLLLIDVPRPEAGGAGSVSISGSTLSYRPLENFLGTVSVRVTVSDGADSVSRAFRIFVRRESNSTNTPPVLDAISDKTMPQAQDYIRIPLRYSDADNDPLSVTVSTKTSDHVAYELDQEHNFSSDGNSRRNFAGRGEILVRCRNGRAWCAIDPHGGLFEWVSSWHDAKFIAQLDPSYNINPKKIIDVAAPSSSKIGTSVSGDSLTINPPASFYGFINVAVEVSDSSASARRNFQVIVEKTRDQDAPPEDSDGDGISDDQELNDGTDPFDSGSFVQHLGSPVYTLWNSFLGMINILELINPNAEDAVARVYLYGIDGSLLHQQNVRVPARYQFDLILNDLPNFVTDSFGIVKIEFDTLLDGRTVFYRPEAGTSNFEFAFAVNLSNASQGRTAVGFNTYQPSTKASEVNNLVANWLTIVNLENASKRFTVSTYNQVGAKLAERRVTVPAFGRVDLDGGHVLAGMNVVGTHIINPDDPTGSYIGQLIRYGGNTPASQTPTAYSFAFPLVAKAGTGRETHIPISRKFDEDNWVEVTNTLEREVAVEIVFRNSAGQELQNSRVTLPAFGQQHFNASALLDNGETGVVTITPLIANSIVAQSMFYFRNRTTGEITAMFGSQSREAVSSALFGSFNLFLRMLNYLSVFNPTSSDVTVQVTVNNPGSVIEKEFVVPAQGSLVLDMHDSITFQTAPDTYGLIEVHTSGPLVSSENLRVRRMENNLVDFAMPTTVR